MALTYDQAYTKSKKPLGRPMPQELGAKRLPWVFALILIWAALTGARLLWIQVYRHEYYQDRAQRQHSMKMTVDPIRGEIRDRNDEVLATSLPSQILYVTPPVFYPSRSRRRGEDGKIVNDWGAPDMKLARECAGKVAKVLGRSESFVLDRFLRKNEWFLVERQLSPIKVAALKEINKEILNGMNRGASEKGDKADKGAAQKPQRRESIFAFMPDYRRIYPRGSVACQAIGFVNDEGEGQLGVERAYNSMLSGRKGKINALKDGLDNYLLGRESYVETPVNGSRLKLTIDSGIQQIVEGVLEETVAQSGPKTAHCVVVDPNTGEILAMAGTPVFDPNVSIPDKFRGRPEGAMTVSERQELRNWRETQQAARKVHPLEDSYEPGSTMKIFTAAMALEDRKAHIGESIDCMGGTWQYAPGVPPITDSRHDRSLTFEQVLWYSSNIGIAKLGTRLKSADHYRFLKEFGFGLPTGLNFAGETPGRLDAPVTWSTPTQYTLSYGYGLSASPLQVLMAGCAIANGGRLMKPYIVKAVYNDKGALLQEAKPEVRHQVISEETSALMREVLKGVIANGTAKKAALDGAEAFGKTGTSRKVIDGQYDSRRHYASFLGFFPADKPEYGILVMLDEPAGDVTGGDVAAPAFKKIGDAILRYSQSTPHPAKGESVRLTLLDWPVSEGEEAAIHVQKGRTPDVRGMVFRNAVQRVILAGGTVRVAGGGLSAHSTQGAFKVSTQSPEPGKPLPEDKIVTLHLRAQ